MTGDIVIHERGYRYLQEDTICIDYKKKFDLIKSIVNLLWESSILMEHSSMTTQTTQIAKTDRAEDDADLTQQMQASPHQPFSENHGIHESFAKLAASFLESQKVIQNE